MKTMSSFAAAVRATKISTATIVPEHAIRLFDFVIEKAERHAPEGETAEERNFRWYSAMAECVAENLLPEVEPMFIRYLKVLDRNADAELFIETPSYGGEARAQRDAYIACIASLS